jgi:hypothetical protein
MQNQLDKKTKRITFITSKNVFIVTILVTILTILSIWLFGLGKHRTLFENSILSTSILSITFFLFLTIGLYKGIKIKDNIGKLTDNLQPAKLPNFSDAASTGELIQVDEGIEGIISSFLIWLIVTIVLTLFFWVFGVIVWTSIIVFIAMLYWIFYRALRLVFRNSNKCKGNLKTSILYGLGYTILYIFWIYGIILATHFLVK